MTRPVKRVALVLALAAVGLLASAVPAQADDTECVLVVAGTHDNVVVPPGEICDISLAFVRGNIICREEAFCFIGAIGPVEVKGSIICEDGSGCFVFETTAYQNVKCDGCDLLDLFGSYVGGNVQSQSSEGGSFIREVEVGGDVQFEGTGLKFELVDSAVGGDVQIGKSIVMLPAFFLSGMRIDDNDIAGDLQVVETTASRHDIVDNEVGDNLQFFKNTGMSDISGNTIGGNLQCKENAPPPTGTGNTAKQKEDECATL